jgi:hypothetical protein
VRPRARAEGRRVPGFNPYRTRNLLSAGRGGRKLLTGQLFFKAESVVSAHSNRRKIRGDGADLLAELSMPAHHIQLADPRVAASALVGDSADRLLHCVKRADFWKDDPDIARRINDQLASGAI